MKNVSTVFFLFLTSHEAFAQSHRSPYGHPAFVSSFEELNEPALRRQLIKESITGELQRSGDRIKIEGAEYDSSPFLARQRHIALASLNFGFHKHWRFLVLLLDLWSRKSGENVKVIVFDWSGQREAISGKLVRVGENGDYGDPYLVLRLKGDVDRNISLRRISFTDLIEDNGFNEMFRERKSDSKLISCRKQFIF